MSNPIDSPARNANNIQTNIPLKASVITPKTAPKVDRNNDADLVDIRSINSNILLDIRYATENNFMKRKVYPVARCLLRRVVAEKLSQVQQDLEKQGLGLKVYDCYRPLSVQKIMWQIMPNPRYVANPATGSRHNRAAAVDLTLVNSKGEELEMPTEFDNFTNKAHRNYMGGSRESLRHRYLLTQAMQKRGFIPLSTEWWHFDAVGWQKFDILDVPLESEEL